MIAMLIASFLIALGLLGTILPVIPGTVIAFAGMLFHKLALGEASVSWGFVAVAFGITLLTLLIDAWASWWGARRFGASWKGALGAVLGGLFGFLFFNLPGLILGPIAGAVLFELLDNRSGPEAACAGFGTVVGAILAFFLKLGLTAGISAAFYISLVAGA